MSSGKIFIRGLPAPKRDPTLTLSKHEQDIKNIVATLKDDLRRQVAAISKQLELVEKLAEKTTPQKINLLFNLWDRNGDGRLQFSEIALGVRKFQGPYGSLEEAAQQAVAGIIEFDRDAANALSRQDFELFLNRLCENAGCQFDDIAEFMILQFTAEDTPEEVAESFVLQASQGEVEKELTVAKKFEQHLTNPAMIMLFELFDVDQNEEIDFKELAQGLEAIDPEATFDETVQAAMSALLIFDENTGRTLDYLGFVRFMLVFCQTVDIAPDELVEIVAEAKMAQKLQSAIALTEAPNPESEEGQVVAVVKQAETFRKMKSRALNVLMEEYNREQDVITTAMDARSQAIFSLWDSDKNGKISFKELVIGLKKFTPSQGLSESAALAAAMLLAFDDDEDTQLNFEEFVNLIQEYCSMVGSSFDELADYLVVASMLDTSSPEDLAKLESVQPVVVVALANDDQERLD